MNNEKRRPTLDELRSLPVVLWQLEVSQICVDACSAEQFKIVDEAALLWHDPEITPEKIVALRERLQRATGSTVEEQKEVA